jgi:hypothetical protein
MTERMKHPQTMLHKYKSMIIVTTALTKNATINNNDNPSSFQIIAVVGRKQDEEYDKEAEKDDPLPPLRCYTPDHMATFLTDDDYDFDRISVLLVVVASCWIRKKMMIDEEDDVGFKHTTCGSHSVIDDPMEGTESSSVADGLFLLHFHDE